MSHANPLFNLFGQSPLTPLERHMEVVVQGVAELIPFFDAVLNTQWDKAQQARNAIENAEQQADRIKRDLRLHLPKSLFLPVARGDLLVILSQQDRIMNKAKDISGLVLGRRMTIPISFAHDFMTFLQRCIDAANQANKAINELEDLLETGFRGKEVQLVEEMIIDLDRIENDTDHLQISLRQKLFALETSLAPIDVMFMYKIIEWSGDVANHAQSVGEHLQLLLAR